MESLGDYRPGRVGHPGRTGSTTSAVYDNRIGDPAYRSHIGFNLILQHYARLARIPDDGISVCAACSAINLCDLQSETGFLHSQSYHALAASAMQKCRLCICLLQALHDHIGIGDPNQALVHLNPRIPGMSIRLRSIVDKESGETRSLDVRIENWTLSPPTAGLQVLALPGTAAARAGFGVRLPYGEQEKWTAMKSWLDKQMRDQTTNPPPPTRLIDVGEAVDAHIRLVETTLVADNPRYAALSYRWGDTNRLLTTTDSIRDRMTEIPPDSMPRTIRDAVTATQRLGLRYLWVDCLCIIQGDEDDWKREAAGMGDVYMNAHCTFSTHAAKHADDGFLAESLQRERVYACGGHVDGEPFQDEMTAYNKFVDFPKDTDPPLASDSFFISKGSYARHHLNRSELSSRGWVLQERILSRRLIHFGPGGSLYFESREGVEHVETGLEPTYHPFPRLRHALKRLDQRDTTPTPPDVVQHVYTDWYEIVMRFSACSLSKPEDKLVALQGIARKCQELTGDILMDGVWSNASGFCLLWLSQEEPLGRNTSTHIPSWSWASVHGKIQFPHGTLQLDIRNITPEVDIAGIETAPTQKSVLRLDNVVRINTHLRFMKGRVGIPGWDNLVLHVNLEHATRYWDVHDDDGQHLGWASLDHETSHAVGGLTEDICCIKIASNRNDPIERGIDRGFLVLFVVFSSQLGAWQRVGMGQILDRRRFQSEAVGMKLV